jgi:hypothetical protein
MQKENWHIWKQETQKQIGERAKYSTNIEYTITRKPKDAYENKKLQKTSKKVFIFVVDFFNIKQRQQKVLNSKILINCIAHQKNIQNCELIPLKNHCLNEKKVLNVCEGRGRGVGMRLLTEPGVKRPD